MSLPGLIATPILQATSSATDVFFNIFNTNPYFIGLMMLVLNLGGKYLGMDVSKGQERFFQNPWFRRFIIFTVLFISTRNIWVALTLGTILIILLHYLLNENSSLFLFKSKSSDEQPEKKEPVSGLTQEETDILQRLSDKRTKIDAAKENEKKSLESKQRALSSFDAYKANMSFLRV